MNPNSGYYGATANVFAGDFSGVAELAIVRSDLGSGMLEDCTGALLSDGVSILTSAHCVADQYGVQRATTAYVTFTLKNGSYTTRAARFQVNPLYNGQVDSPNDIAVLTLTAPAPSGIARYGLYSGSTLDQTITIAGYGFGGTGDAGYDEIDYPNGTLRVGQNQYDAASPNDGLLYFDFDDGLAAHDALGGMGLRKKEAFVAPGDFGGPSFINGQIAGIHSYVARTLGAGGADDIDSILNSSFGEYAADVSVSYNAGFLQSLTSSTPEPKTMFLVGIALVSLSTLGIKRRQQ
jgi:hypothetical protein